METLVRTWVLFAVISVKTSAHICDSYSQWIYVGYEQPFDTISDIHNNITYYKSLSKALMLDNLNDSCIVIQDDVTLYDDITKWDVKRLYLTSSSSNKRVTCSENVGIAFHRSANLRIANLVYFHCGKKRKSKRVCSDGKCFSISSALFFEDAFNISLHNLKLLKSVGYALSILDSDEIFLDSLIMKGNLYKDRKKWHGGLFLQYSESYQVIGTYVRLKNCTFLNNVASSHGPVNNKMLPFGKGGAIVILYLGNTSGNILRFSNGIIGGNQAKYGGGVYLYFAEYAVNNSVTFDNDTLFTNNKAWQNGGGLFVLQKKTGNFVYLSNVDFVSNHAHVAGGGIFSILDNDNYSKFYMSHINDYGSGKIICRQCVFSMCKAMMGSAVYFQGVTIDFISLYVGGCNVSKSIKNHGTVYALDSYINLFGNTKIANNVGTAMVLDYSKLNLNGFVLFSHNYGYNGGAVSLYGYSRITLAANSVLEFENNYASNKGGAIFSSVVEELSVFWSYKYSAPSKCFFQFEESANKSVQNITASVIFKNNDVETGFGTDIYCSTVLICRRPEDSSVNDILRNWKQFKFSSNQSNLIVTNPHKIVVFNESDWDVYPGQIIMPSIHLLDERDNSVEGTAEITFSSPQVSIEENVGFVVSNRSKIQLSLLGKENYKYFVKITLTSGVNLLKVILNRHLKFCPFGFKYSKESRKCVCDFKMNRAKGIAECDGQNIYLYHDRWVPVEINGYRPNSNISSYSCPVGYCKLCKKSGVLSGINCLFQRRNQCTEKRNQSSRLCSRCVSGYSVTIGGLQECEDCSGTYNWIWITLLIIICLSIFIILLVLLQLDIMSYYLHGYIYSYQIMFYLYSPSQPIDSCLSVIMGLVQFTYLNSAFPKACLWDGMNNLQKIAYNYVIPFWMLIFSFLLINFASVHSASRFSKSKCFHALTIAATMIYSDLIRNSFLILVYITIEGEKYSYIYADSRYAEGEHLPYFIMAIIVLAVFVFLFPILLFKRIFSRYMASKPNDYILAELSYYFKKSRVWFLPFYFLTRILVFAIGIFISNGPLQTASVGLACLAVFHVFSIVSPYADEKANLIESLLLANLTIIGIISLGTYSVYLDEVKVYLNIIIQVLSYIPVIALLISILFRIYYRFSAQVPEVGQDSHIPIPNRVRRDSEDGDYHAM